MKSSKQRGRKSGTSLATVAVMAPLPPPPIDLTKAEAAQWNEIVFHQGADYFGRETFPLLTQLCRHIVASHHVAAMIREAELDKECSLHRYSTLLLMQQRESKWISTLSDKMRLSHVATSPQPQSYKRPAIGRPWDAEAA